MQIFSKDCLNLKGTALTNGMIRLIVLKDGSIVFCFVFIQEGSFYEKIMAKL